MREPIDRTRLEAVLRRLGQRAIGPGRLYLTGGATAVLFGWRDSTVDIDIRLDPEPRGVFDAIRTIKEELRVNVELASPQDFIPPLPQWESQALFVGQYGPIEVFHYPLVAQALAKIERSHARDRIDVTAMLARALITKDQLRNGFAAIADQLARYPAIDVDSFAARLAEYLHV